MHFVTKKPVYQHIEKIMPRSVIRGKITVFSLFISAIILKYEQTISQKP